MNAKEIFTPEFYKKLYDELLEKANKDWYYEDVCESGHLAMDCECDWAGDIYVVLNDVEVGTEVHDDSFDHAFGTWHDPHPYLEVTCIEGLSDVHVYENSNRDAKEIEGFDIEAFFKANEN